MPKKHTTKVGERRYNLTCIRADSVCVAGTKTYHIRVKCDCGTEIEIVRGNFGKQKACRLCGNKLTGQAKVTHGGSSRGIHEPAYKVWQSMKNRCKSYSKLRTWYYDKGIKVCDAWVNDYNAFRSWALREGYQPGLSIDRIDTDKGYQPDNCQWVTRSQNSKRITGVAQPRLNPFTEHLPIEMLWGVC